MIRLIKKVDNILLYWEVWEDDKILTVHYGIIGDTGETEEIKLRLFQNAEKVMEKLAKDKLNEGYKHLDEDELIELVVQYPYEENHMEEALELRYMVEDLMNECLGWTGNGFCDGGDVGSGTINIFNYVIDVEKAFQSTLSELSEGNLLKGVKIAYENDKGDYIALYPKGSTFDLR